MRKPSGIFDLISSAWTAFEIRFSFVLMKKIRLKFFLMTFFFCLSGAGTVGQGRHEGPGHHVKGSGGSGTIGFSSNQFNCELVQYQYRVLMLIS